MVIMWPVGLLRMAKAVAFQSMPSSGTENLSLNIWILIRWTAPSESAMGQKHGKSQSRFRSVLWRSDVSIPDLLNDFRTSTSITILLSSQKHTNNASIPYR